MNAAFRFRSSLFALLVLAGRLLVGQLARYRQRNGDAGWSAACKRADSLCSDGWPIGDGRCDNRQRRIQRESAGWRKTCFHLRAKVVGKRKMYETPDSPTVDVVEELLPERYNAQSELSITVKAGSQEAEFPLESGK